MNVNVTVETKADVKVYVTTGGNDALESDSTLPSLWRQWRTDMKMCATVKVRAAMGDSTLPPVEQRTETDTKKS